MRDEQKKSIRIERLQIIGIDGGDWKDRKQQWGNLTITTRRVLNDLRCLWLAEHLKAGNHVKVRKWMEADMVWAKGDKKTRGKRVRCPVQPWSNDLGKAVYRQLTKLHPYITTRCITLALNHELGSKGTSGQHFPPPAARSRIARRPGLCGVRS